MYDPVVTKNANRAAAQEQNTTVLSAEFTEH